MTEMSVGDAVTGSVKYIRYIVDEKVTGSVTYATLMRRSRSVFRTTHDM